MIRTQISLPEEQMHRLREVAARRGISMAAFIRAAVETALTGDPDDPARRWHRASRAVGAYRSDDADAVARDHDRYLADAFTRDRQ